MTDKFVPSIQLISFFIFNELYFKTINAISTYLLVIQQLFNKVSIRVHIFVRQCKNSMTV